MKIVKPIVEHLCKFVILERPSYPQNNKNSGPNNPDGPDEET